MFSAYNSNQQIKYEIDGLFYFHPDSNDSQCQNCADLFYMFYIFEYAINLLVLMS